MSDNFQFQIPQHSERPYTISEINDGIARILEAGNTLVWVEGEISNWKPSSSGHCYFRLKDQESQIPAVIWKSSAAQLKFKPRDGDAIMAIASIRVYQKGGYYQLDIHRMQALGDGALYAAFEKLKAKLEKEGLFDPCHKKPLPVSVNRVGIITSKRGAALRDIIRVIASRSPQTDIVLIDVQVQGEKAAPEIAAAIRQMNEYGNVDCIITGRGGGSIEDLWAFNEEIVARAIYESGIPVISAVGHEVDFTIADFAADVRAPTPSVAGEIVVPDNRENARYFSTIAGRFAGASQRYFYDIQQQFNALCNRGSLKRPLRLLMELNQHKDDLEEQCCRNLGIVLQRNFSRFSAAAAKLNALSPLSVLARGYSVVTTENGTTVRSSKQVSAGMPVTIRFFDGKVRGTITSTAKDTGDTVAF
ncbi:MAG: exodeoxyribonuclease VII large subunit [Fibrobacter sp.]|nr:exodeoxyribonuclease VII large subunit [Fibrobacter sp.]